MRRKRLLSYSQSSDENLLNLTPLIDVVFVVLVAFILIAPMLEVDHVDLAPATITSTTSVTEKSKITIYVKADNTIYLNNKKITEKQLTASLKETKKALPNFVPQIYHDKDASFGTYQNVKNAVESAGFIQMDVILKPH
jgi:biopolymer transport protein ExbD